MKENEIPVVLLELLLANPKRAFQGHQNLIEDGKGLFSIN